MNLCEAAELLDESNYVNHPRWPKTLQLRNGGVLDGFRLIMHYPGGGQESFSPSRDDLLCDKWVVRSNEGDTGGIAQQ